MDTPTSESLPSAVPEIVNGKLADEFEEEHEERKFEALRSQNSVQSAWSQGIRTIRYSKAFYGEVWQHTGDAWAELYRFNNGLEFDVYSQQPSRSVWSRLQLPSTSLRALQQLRAAMRLPGALELDTALNGSTSSDLFDALLEQAGMVLRAIGGGGASQSEARALLEGRSGSLTSERENEDLETKSACSEVLAQPIVGTEAIDVYICPLETFPIGKPPVIAILRLSSPMRLRRGAYNANALCFAALILCSSEDPDDTRYAREFSRALAISFMDEEFAVAARMTPQGSPERVLGSFDSFLAALTLVPTVYMEPPNPKLSEKALRQFAKEGEEENEVPQWESDVNTVRYGYLLSDSLADSIERRICKAKGIESEKRGDAKLHRQRQIREEHPPEQRRRFFVEVHERAGPDRRWVATRRLRQGLQVDITPGETMPSPPHLPRLSAAALERMIGLMKLDSIGLESTADDAHVAVRAIVEQLGHAGLPEAANAEVLNTLMDAATSWREIPSPKPVWAAPGHPQQVLQPCPGDEACHVLMVASTALPDEHAIISAFLRFNLPIEGEFASCECPVRFVMVLLGPAGARLELCRLKDALSALLLDEDLMGDLTLAHSQRDFRSKVKRHVNNLVFISHTQLQMGSATLPAAENKCDSSAGLEKCQPPLLETVAKDESTAKPPSPPAPEDTHRMRKRFFWCVGKLQKYSVPLVTGVIIAMIWENVHHESYHDFTHTPFWSGASLFKHDFNLHFLVNDIFMCFFFGLAIKEVTEALLPGGSLHPLRRAANPLFATCGGIVGPVAVYILCVFIFDKLGTFDSTMCIVEVEPSDHRRLAGGASKPMGETREELCSLSVMMKGWGVPTATDISLAWMFALLVFGAGHPCINFLLLLAIVDDALGMVIIAVFYPNPEMPVEPLWLILLLGAIALAMFFRLCKLYYWQLYVFVAGPVSWLALIKAHVHPALALCVVVPFMPAQMARQKRKKTERHISLRLSRLGGYIRNSGKAANKLAENKIDANKIVQTIDDVTDDQRARAVERATALLERSAHAPLHSFEHAMKLPVDLGMFFFGLANAGVQVGSMGGITLSVVVALLVGKTFGIAGFGLLAVCLGFDLPDGIGVGDLFAVSALGGVGLTVALFVANQAFTGENLKAEAKMGAVLSVGCAIVAFAIQFLFGGREEPQDQFEEEPAKVDDEEADVSQGVPINVHSPVDDITDFAGKPPTDADFVDDLLVDDILQTLWTQRRYNIRGTAMPTPNRRGSITVERGGRRASLTRRNSFDAGGGRPRRSSFSRQISDGFRSSHLSLEDRNSLTREVSAPAGSPFNWNLRSTASSVDMNFRNSPGDNGERVIRNGERRRSTKEILGERFRSNTRQGRSTPTWASRQTTPISGRKMSKQSVTSITSETSVVDDVQLSSPRTLA